MITNLQTVFELILLCLSAVLFSLDKHLEKWLQLDKS